MGIEHRNLIRELNHSMPAAMHAGLGDLLEALILGHNAALGQSARKFSLGSPIAPATDAFVKAATGTELPDTETVTYTPLTDNTSPLDGAIAAPTSILMEDGSNHLVWTIDVPRNITSVTTHSSAVVAMDIVVSGFDKYKNPIAELIAVTAGGTTKTIAGKKAFKYVSSIAITAAASAEANTLNMGFGDVLGLPYQLVALDDLGTIFFNHVAEASAATVLADTGTVSNTSGDPRGTVDMTSASNGSPIDIWFLPAGTDFAAASEIIPLSLR